MHHFSPFFAQTGNWKPLFFVEAPFLVLYTVFSQEELFGDWKALTIENLLMSGRGQGHQPTLILYNNCWLKFPVLCILAEVEMCICTVEWNAVVN